MLTLDAWIEVAQYLTSAEWTSLMLTPKLLYYNMPRKGSLIQLINHSDDLDESWELPEGLLTLLERDLPTHRLCLPCMQLHQKISKYRLTYPGTHVWENRSGGRCQEGYVPISVDDGIDWSVIQYVMRLVREGRQDVDQTKLLTIGQYWIDDQTGREYYIRARTVFGRLLLKVDGKVVIEGHYPPYAADPMLVSAELLDGVPRCRCLEGHYEYESPTLQTIMCALLHSNTAMTAMQSLIHTSPVNVIGCRHCAPIHECTECGTESHISLQKWEDIGSDAYLNITRLIDCGPVNSALYPDQHQVDLGSFSGPLFFRRGARLHPESCGPMSRGDQLMNLRARIGGSIARIFGMSSASLNRMTE